MPLLQRITLSNGIKLRRLNPRQRGQVESLFWEYAWEMKFSLNQAFAAGLMIYASLDLRQCWGIYEERECIGFFATFRCLEEDLKILKSRDVREITGHLDKLKSGPVLYFAEAFVVKPRLAYKIFRAFIRRCRVKKVCAVRRNEWHEMEVCRNGKERRRKFEYASYRSWATRYLATQRISRGDQEVRRGDWSGWRAVAAGGGKRDPGEEQALGDD